MGIVFRTVGNLSCDFSDKHQIKPASCTAPESSQQPQPWLEASTPLDQPPLLSSLVQSKPLQFKETSTPLLNSLVPELLPLALLVRKLDHRICQKPIIETTAFLIRYPWIRLV